MPALPRGISAQCRMGESKAVYGREGAGWRVLVSACTLSVVMSVAAMAAPITFNSALPVAKGRFIGRVQLVRAGSRPDAGALRRQRDSSALLGVLGYGISPKLAVFGLLRVVEKRLRLDVANGSRRIRSAEGIGDAQLFARYTLLQRDAVGSTLRLAPFLGVELPTGSNHRNDGQGELPPSVQPGSGAVDVFAGLTATRQTLDYQLDAQIRYQPNRQADGFDPGDVWRADLSVQYRIWPRHLGAGVPGFLYGVMETNLLRRSRNHRQGSREADSGGNTLFLSPGLQYVTRRWIAEAALQWPLINHANGDALRPGPVVRGGFRVNF